MLAKLMFISLVLFQFACFAFFSGSFQAVYISVCILVQQYLVYILFYMHVNLCLFDVHAGCIMTWMYAYNWPSLHIQLCAN